MFVVDTNVFLYAADQSYSEHTRCRKLLEKWRRQALPWCTTWAIVYEFLRVSTHPRVFNRPWTVREAWRFIEAVLAAPSLSMLEHTSRHPAVAAQTLAELSELRGNILHDAHTAILMREHGIRRIYTRDNDFQRFPFLEVVDPLKT